MFDIPLHVLFNHFPIVLASVAFVYDTWAVYARRPDLHDVGYELSVWAAISALAAVVTGLQIAGLGQIGKGAIAGHALFGVACAIVLTAFGLWRYSARARQEGPDENYLLLWLVLQGLAVLLTVAAAITGHHLILGAG
jgi:uncharacterized membrane protein